MSKRARVKKQWQDFEVAGSESEGIEDAQDSDSHLHTSAGLSKAAAAGRGRPPRKAPAHASSDADDATDQDQQEDNDSSSDSDEEARPPRKTPARRGAAAAAGAPKQRKKQQPKQAQEKKGPMIGAVKARQLYILDDDDLARMKDVKHNHIAFGFFGFGTKLFSPRELEGYARKKHAGSQWALDRLDANLQRQDEKRERKRGYRATATAAAKQALTHYVAPRTALEVEQYGETKLPDSVLVHVMVCLARTREPGGLRGFACVAKDLANASLANWDFHRAAKAGFAALGDEASSTPHPPMPRGSPFTGLGLWGLYHRGTLERLPGPESLGGWAFWEDFLRVPLKPTVVKMKEAMRVVGLKPKGTKAEMAVRVLGVFGLEAATAVPVQLLRVVGLERSSRLAWDGPDASALHERVNTAVLQLVETDKETWQHLMKARERGVAGLRVAIRGRFDSIDAFVATAADAADTARRQREAREDDERDEAEERAVAQMMEAIVAWDPNDFSVDTLAAGSGAGAGNAPPQPSAAAAAGGPGVLPAGGVLPTALQPGFSWAAAASASIAAANAAAAAAAAAIAAGEPGSDDDDDDGVGYGRFGGGFVGEVSSESDGW